MELLVELLEGWRAIEDLLGELAGRVGKSFCFDVGGRG